MRHYTSFYRLKAGEELLLEVVLATFLGAAFSPRRVVTLWGAVLGAVLVTALSVGFKSIGVNVFWTGCIKGALILIIIACFFAFFAIYTESFLNGSNLVNIVEGSSILLIIALGMTLVVALGGIDLSVGIAFD